MPLNLTTAQRDVLAGFRFTKIDDLFNAQKQIDGANEQLAYWQLVDGAYVNEQQDLMDLLDEKLLAKAAALQLANPDPDGDSVVNARSVVYGGTHPNNAGIVPTDWLVRYQTAITTWAVASPLVITATSIVSVKSLDGLITYVEGVDYTVALDTPVPGDITVTDVAILTGSVRVTYAPATNVTEYSHSVNWDSNAEILSWESGWLELYNARFNQYWGSQINITSFTLALTVLNALVTIINGREAAAVADRIRAYVNWLTESPLSTRQPVFEVVSLAEDIVYVQDTHYTVTPDEDDPDISIIEAIVDDQDVSQLPATVRVRVP